MARDPVRRNSVQADELRTLVERIERVREQKKAAADDESAIYAEAKSRGYTPKYLRAIVRLRRLPPSERQEDGAMLDIYLGAIGMAQEPPLFRAVARMGVDTGARDAVIDALKLLVPSDGEIIVKCGGAPMRLWRDRDGTARAEEHVEPARAAAQGRGKSRPAGSDRPRAEVPAVDGDGAEALGRAAAAADLPIIANPFPWDDKRRARWDLGWRRGAGSDGMGPAESAPGGDGGGDGDGDRADDGSEA